LRELRLQALKVMRDLEPFNPYLTGSVLSGNAGKYADINLQLYAPSPKAVELYLIDRDVEYRAGQRRLYVGDTATIVPTLTTVASGVEIELVVLSLDDLRRPVRSTLEGKPIERARREAVEALLQAL
jgi:hypothetical protein